MKQIWTICCYTIRDAVSKKAFKISTALILALVLILCALPSIIESFSDDEDVTESTSQEFEDDGAVLYYQDEAGLIPGAEEYLAAFYEGVTVTPCTAAEAESLRSEIAEDDTKVLVCVTEQEGLPSLTVVTKSFLSAFDTDTLAQILSTLYITSVLDDMGLGEEIITLAQAELPCTVEQAGNMELGGYTLSIVLTLLIFMAIYYYGYGVSMSVATEKTSRVMETLVVSVKPSRILLGKCLGMGLVGLMQYALVLLTAAAGYQLLVPEDFNLMGEPLSFDSLTPASTALLTVYFLLGYALYAAMNAVCGAMVSKIEDLNSAMMPVMMISILSFYVGYMAGIMDDSGILSDIALYVPFCSPFYAPVYLLNHELDAGAVALSISILAVSMIAVLLLSIRLYSSSVLHYGKKRKLSELIRRS